MVTLRRASVGDAASIAEVHVASWRSTYRNIVPEACLAALNAADRRQMWEQFLPELRNVFVAERDGEIVGFASAGAAREPVADADCELYTVYLLENVQRQGLGSALVQAVVADAAAAGHRTMALWVLKANPAMAFYAALGAVPVREQEIEMGGVMLAEVAYLWRDLPAVAEALANRRSRSPL